MTLCVVVTKPRVLIEDEQIDSLHEQKSLILYI